MLEKIKNALFRFMNGRYGTDALNNFLLFASLAVLLINTLTFKSVFLGLLGDVLIFGSLFRTCLLYTSCMRKSRRASAS